MYKNLDNYIVSIVKNYNKKEEGVCEVPCREEIIKAISGMYGKEDTVFKLIECIETLVINDLDVGDAYYTKTEGKPTLKKFIEQIKDREDRSSLKLKVISWNGRINVITMKLDNEFWAPYQLKKSSSGWQRSIIK